MTLANILLALILIEIIHIAIVLEKIYARIKKPTENKPPQATRIDIVADK